MIESEHTVRNLPTVHVLGSHVHLVERDQVVDIMEDWIDHRDGRCRMIAVTGFHGIWEGHLRPEFRRILNGADLWVPDGIAPVWVARLHGKRAQRLPGAELMAAFLERADRRGFRSFFYGDTDPTLALLRENLERQYPGHIVAGTFSPPFRSLSAQEDEEIVRMINDARPDVVWVGLGLPKQDIWVHEHRDRLTAPIALGVGAAFRFLAGNVKRVPDFIGNVGLEWAWRLACEPSKLWRRALIQGPQFAGHVLLELTGLRKYE